MTEIHLFQNRCGCYQWKVLSKNGTEIAYGKQYITKFHCKKMAEWLFPTFKLIDKTKDRRRRA